MERQLLSIPIIASRPVADRRRKWTNATISHFIDKQLRLENMLGASRILLTMLAGADGRVVDNVYGAREWDGPEALQLIDRALRCQPASTDR
ncbi:MAG: hypothetical protein IH627_10385 [Rubrivivax sp.]|nr:hypothetical protein [Rubrivivax sp.]